MKWHKCFALTSSVILNFDWFTECLNRTDLVSLPAGISCHNPSSCTAVSCCLEIERFGGRLMEVSLDYSPCGNYLDITIDRIPIKQYLTGFQYGKGRCDPFVSDNTCKYTYLMTTYIWTKWRSLSFPATSVICTHLICRHRTHGFLEGNVQAQVRYALPLPPPHILFKIIVCITYKVNKDCMIIIWHLKLICWFSVLIQITHPFTD